MLSCSLRIRSGQDNISYNLELVEPVGPVEAEVLQVGPGEVHHVLQQLVEVLVVGDGDRRKPLGSYN